MQPTKISAVVTQNPSYSSETPERIKKKSEVELYPPALPESEILKPIGPVLPLPQASFTPLSSQKTKSSYIPIKVVTPKIYDGYLAYFEHYLAEITKRENSFLPQLKALLEPLVVGFAESLILAKTLQDNEKQLKALNILISWWDCISEILHNAGVTILVERPADYKAKISEKGVVLDSAYQAPSLVGKLDRVKNVFNHANFFNLASILEIFTQCNFDYHEWFDEVCLLDKLHSNEDESKIRSKIDKLTSDLFAAIQGGDSQHYSELAEKLFPAVLDETPVSAQWFFLVAETIKHDPRYTKAAETVKNLLMQNKGYQKEFNRLDEKMKKNKTYDAMRHVELVQIRADNSLKVMRALERFITSVTGFYVMKDLRTRTDLRGNETFPEKMPDELLANVLGLLKLPALTKDHKLNEKINSFKCTLECFMMEACADNTLSGKINYLLDNFGELLRFEKEFENLKSEMKKLLINQKMAKEAQEKEALRKAKVKKEVAKAQEKSKQVKTSSVPVALKPKGVEKPVLTKKATDDLKLAVVTPKVTVKPLTSFKLLEKPRIFVLHTEVYGGFKILTRLANNDAIYFLIDKYISKSSFPSCFDSFVYHFKKHANTHNTTFEQYLCNAVKAKGCWNGYDVRLSLSKNDAHDRDSKERLAVIYSNPDFMGQLIFHRKGSAESGKIVTFSKKDKEYPKDAVDEWLEHL